MHLSGTRFTLSLIGSLSALVAPLVARADAITDWNAKTGAVVAAACLAENPLHESRLYAMVHLAAHDAVNAVRKQSRAYAYQAPANPAASPQAAIAVAARDVLLSQIALAGVPAECVTAGKARVEAEFNSALATVAPGSARDQGMAIGQKAAAAIIARRQDDGSTRPIVNPAYPQGTAPGQWRFTPGSPPVAFGPEWGNVKPFALHDAAQFQPPPPLPVSCESKDKSVLEGCRKYATDLEEIRKLGSDGVSAPSARTADQTQVALFWLESSPASWNRMARTLSSAQGLDLWQNARLFALLNVAQADGYIASWATKYRYKFWRPVTAVREAANDGNPGTNGDAAWMSLRPTPPVPDYESAHAVEGAAAAEVMKQVFGRDAIEFSHCSFTLDKGSNCGDEKAARRQFHSLAEAARENGESRVLVGFHFRDAVEKGLKRGNQIGRWTVEHVLEPEH